MADEHFVHVSEALRLEAVFDEEPMFDGHPIQQDKGDALAKFISELMGDETGYGPQQIRLAPMAVAD